MTSAAAHGSGRIRLDYPGEIAEGRRGSVVSLMCDAGDRYAGSYYNADWLRARNLDPQPHEATIRTFFDSGIWPA